MTKRLNRLQVMAENYTWSSATTDELVVALDIPANRVMTGSQINAYTGSYPCWNGKRTRDPR